MNVFYSTPFSISELGTSDHYMVLWKPCGRSPDIRGNVTRVSVKFMGPAKKSLIRHGFGQKYLYHQTIINNLMEHCFPITTVTRHTADKPWITDLFRNLIRKRQRACYYVWYSR